MAFKMLESKMMSVEELRNRLCDRINNLSSRIRSMDSMRENSAYYQLKTELNIIEQRLKKLRQYENSQFKGTE